MLVRPGCVLRSPQRQLLPLAALGPLLGIVLAEVEVIGAIEPARLAVLEAGQARVVPAQVVCVCVWWWWGWWVEMWGAWCSRKQGLGQ